MRKSIVLSIVFFAICFATTLQAQQGQHGSLAIDAINGNQYGWAINFKTQAEANKKAVAECEKNGGDNCHTVLWFEGGCAVYVVDKNQPGLYGYGYADTQQKAEQLAKKEAYIRGAENLTVRVWGCNKSPIKNAKAEAPAVQGIFVFHFIKSETYKKAFISNSYYESNVVKKNADSWSWTADAQKQMTKKARAFMIEVNNNLYSYLTPKQRLTFLPEDANLDWEGASEFKYLKKRLDGGSIQMRKEKFESFKNGLQKSIEEDGYTIVNINL